MAEGEVQALDELHVGLVDQHCMPGDLAQPAVVESHQRERIGSQFVRVLDRADHVLGVAASGDRDDEFVLREPVS